MNASELLERGREIGVPKAGASPPVDVEGWPGRTRRWPSVGDASYLLGRPLARGIAKVVQDDLASRAPVAVLDAGCGVKPYLPFFAAVAGDYVGLDVGPGPQVDVVGAAEDLPFPDESFDVTLSTQALEHVLEPDRVIREVYRVLRPGGIAMVSTHGTMPYHPAPTDLWRWTQEGLKKVFDDNGEWRALDLTPCGGTAACFGYLYAWYTRALLLDTPFERLSRLPIALINLTFGALDRIVPLHYPRKFTLISNFLVIARK